MQPPDFVVDVDIPVRRCPSSRFAFIALAKRQVRCVRRPHADIVCTSGQLVKTQLTAFSTNHLKASGLEKQRLCPAGASQDGFGRRTPFFVGGQPILFVRIVHLHRRSPVGEELMLNELRPNVAPSPSLKPDPLDEFLPLRVFCVASEVEAPTCVEFRTTEGGQAIFESGFPQNVKPSTDGKVLFLRDDNAQRFRTVKSAAQLLQQSICTVNAASWD
jgi:hypothetical protein